VDAAGEGELGLEVLLAVDEAAALEGLGDQVEDLVGSTGLGDVVVGAALDGVDGGGDGALAGDDDDLDLGGGLLDVIEELEAAHAGEGQIGEDDVELALVELGDGLDRVVGRDHRVALGRQPHAQGFARARIVVDDEDASRVPHRELDRSERPER
jgi:hypothetical protein